NTSILDAGWATFTEMVSVKAAWAGRTVLFVNPFMTSQHCSGCGAVVKKDLSERWHRCSCGTELDRDTNSAKLILNLGYKQLSGGAGGVAWLACGAVIVTSASTAWAIVPESSSPRVTVTTFALTPDILFTTASASVSSTRARNAELLG